MRAGDTLYIPKRPSFVVVSGQVYNPAAISYVPGKDLTWYLRKAGGATPLGEQEGNLCASRGRVSCAAG